MDALSPEESDIILLSIFYQDRVLAAVMYNCTTSQMSILETCCSNSKEMKDSLERIILQFGISIFLVSSRMEISMGILSFLSEYNQLHHTQLESRVVKHSDFDFGKACQSLKQLRISQKNGEDASGVAISYFDYGHKPLVRACGGRDIEIMQRIADCMPSLALLLHLMTEKIGRQLEDQACIVVQCVTRVALQGIMFIDATTLTSLNILCNEHHPSLLKETGRAKAGLSLFGLLNRTVTRRGASLLRKWMLAPLTDIQAINDRLDVVQYFYEHSNDELRLALISQLKQFRDISSIFNRIRNRVASSHDWCHLYRSINCFLTARLHISSIVETGKTIPIFAQVVAEDAAIHMSNLLGNVIDIEETSQSDNVIIQQDVSSALDAARTQYNDLDNVLTEVAYQICEKYPVLKKITVQYIPQVGYVICCDSPTVLPDFTFQFQEDDNTFYYKDECCRDLDASIGDIFGHIQDMQRDLVEQLTITILGYESSIHNICQIAAYLDVCIALADGAKTFNFTRPNVHERIEMQVKQARHPLQELLVEQFIPNDISIIGGKSHALIHVITGHNGSGKSVYLKMIGVVQYMAQIGSFVPAQQAMIGVASHIFSRIQSLESASMAHSSFTIDCTQMARMLHQCDRNSLLLIDEFGKGTAELDGLSLLSATINYILDQVQEHGGPRVIITTHQLDIVRKKCVPRKANAIPPIFTMLATAQPNNTPLHEIRLGVAEGSNAFGCALASGIPKEILQRAAQIMELRRQKLSITPHKTALERQETFIKQLSAVFYSVSDWNCANDEIVNTLLLTARLAESN